MRNTMVVATVLIAAGLPVPAAVAAPSSTDRIAIDVVAVAGCPVDSVLVEGSPDNASFRLWFDALAVEIGPDASPAAARRTCQVALSIQMPAGSAYAIHRVEYGGYASLAAGAVFTQRARHYRSGQAAVPPYLSRSWTGPLQDVWQAVDTVPAGELHFPPCGTNPNLNAVVGLRLDAGTSDPATDPSFAALDSIDGPYGVVYHLATAPSGCGKR